MEKVSEFHVEEMLNKTIQVDDLPHKRVPLSCQKNETECKTFDLMIKGNFESLIATLMLGTIMNNKSDIWYGKNVIVPCYIGIMCNATVSQNVIIGNRLHAVKLLIIQQVLIINL